MASSNTKSPSHPSLHIVIDNREHVFIEFFRKKCAQFPNNFILEVQALALGDIEIRYQDTCLFVWERKTFRDLFASIKDGRYKEQGHRLEHTCGPSKVIYLIEGIMSQLSEYEQKLAISTMTSISLRKGFHIWRTTTVQDSVSQIFHICMKIAKEIGMGKWPIQECSVTDLPSKYGEIPPPSPPEEVSIVAYGGFVKKVKKENITPSNIGEIFLCQIPDINIASAKAIMRHVNGNFSKLIDTLRNDPSVFETLKMDGPNPRKISKKVIKRLQEFLGNESLPEITKEDDTKEGQILEEEEENK
jgi:hypothetical protein